MNALKKFSKKQLSQNKIALTLTKLEDFCFFFSYAVIKKIFHKLHYYILFNGINFRGK